MQGSSAQTAPLARKLLIALSALLLVAVSVLVIYGMAAGANPEFSRGRSPTSSVVAQEVIGLLTLFAVALCGELGLDLAMRSSSRLDVCAGCGRTFAIG